MKKFTTSLLAIVAGGTLYLAFRPTTLTMFQWIDQIGLSATLDGFRNFSSKYRFIFPDWTIYSLPNALWLFGGIALLCSIWKNEKSGKVFWISSFCLFALGSELAQLLSNRVGTFDFVDMFLMAVSCILALSFDNLTSSKNAKDTSFPN